MPHSLPYLATGAIYLGVALMYWRRSAVIASWPQLALGAALALHGGLLYHALFTADGINLGLASALSAIFWLATLIYWGTHLRHDLHRLHAFVLPLTTVALALQWALPGNHVLAHAHEPLFRLHLVIAFAAYGLFTCAALHAGLMAVAEHGLHHPAARFRLPDFPPIMPMERLLFRMIGTGFALLTLTLASGIFFSEQLFHQALAFSHKTVFSLMAWLIFGGLLAGRWKYGWRGRIALRWTLGGFALLLLAYLGSRFVLEVLLGNP